jgi:pantetheine-phosphate adenylyltransferase
MGVVVYPGTFDPFTNGHWDVVLRASRLFEKVVVLVAGSDSRKSPMVPLADRKLLIERSVESLPTVSVAVLDGLLVDWMRERDYSVVVRGVRSATDFDYEAQQAGMNARLSSDFETVLLPARVSHQMIAGQFVREIVSLGGDVRSFVPAPVAQYLKDTVR